MTGRGVERVQPHAGRHGRAAHDLRDRGRLEVLPSGEHQHLGVAFREPGQNVAYELAVIDLAERVGTSRRIGAPGEPERQPALASHASAAMQYVETGGAI